MHWKPGRTTGTALIVAVIGAVTTIAAAQGRQVTHLVPFFPAASDIQPQGFLRIVNNSDNAGTVTIVAVDDAGSGSDELTLALGASETVALDADGLESGAPERGLTGSTGAGEGDWRLRLTSELDIEPQAFARTLDGSLWEMHETATSVATGAGTDGKYRIATFNPGINVNQVGRLRLVNPGEETAAVAVKGIDDAGLSPGSGISIEIPPNQARTYTAAELESGVASGLEGSLGDGVGKWRLELDSSVPVRVMSLLSSPTGHLTNLSTVPARESGGIHRVPLFPPASDPYGRQGFARVVNRSDVAGEVHIEAFDDAAWTYEALTLSMGARETRHFNSTDLELGNANKGLTGSTGAGAGDWRLDLTSELDIEVLSYVRTVGGFGYVTPMHDTAARETGGLMRYYVPVFHPAGYDGQESRLHLVNLGAVDAQVGISALDDAGRSPPQGDVSLVIAGETTRVLTAEQLQDGDAGLDGRFGTGSGSWRLFVTAEGRLQVMSLGYSPDGFLANLSRGRPPAPDVVVSRPDLVVGTPTVSDSAPVAGAVFTLSARVTNQGDGDAEATTLRYYRSTNAAISPSDVEVGTDRVDALSASGGSGESVAVSAPAEAGTYHYGACVDAVDAESDTTNNCSSSVAVTVAAPPGQADLVVGVPSVSNSQLLAGEAFTLSATVRNRGEAAAPSTTLRYYRSDDAAISSADTPAGTDAVIGLGANGSSGESIPLNAPADAGTYYYGACVDAVADESDTTNNCSSSVAVTVAAPPGQADLVVGVPSVSNSQLLAGEAFTLSATVRNRGEAAAPSTTLRYYRSDDAAISSADTPAGTDAVIGLGANGSSGESIPLNAPADAGTYYYGACVDAVADESDTTNNCSSSVAVTVAAPPDQADLVVGVPSVSNSQLLAGEAFTLSATVRNRGEAAAPSTTLRYYRSDDAAISSADTPAGTDAVIGLGANGSSGESIPLNAPADAGTYYYGACVDTVADESDTTNNCSSSVEMTVTDPAFPDLVVASASASGSNPEPGAEFTLSATVGNQGDAEAAATTLRYYRSADSTISTGDTEVGTDPVEALAVAGTSDESIVLAAPSDSGRYYYGACADAVGEESDTTNNCSSSVDLAVGSSPYHGANMVTTNRGFCTGAMAWFVVDRDSEAEAGAAVVKACESESENPASCRGIGLFRQCAAITFGSQADGSNCGAFGHEGSTRSMAEKDALRVCNIRYSICVVVGSACNSIP